MNYDILKTSTNALIAEKKQALKLAKEEVKKATLNFLKDTSEVNRLLLKQALNDELFIQNYYDEILI